MKNAVLAAWVLAATAGLNVAAQEFPNKPIRLVVPFPAGGGVDSAARNVSNKLAEVLGQPLVVENMPGASGNIGTSNVARAKPDGYTLLFTNNALVSNPALGHVPYDVQKDFTPVGMTGYSLIAVAVHPSIPATNMPQLVELIARSPGKYSYSSCGNGTSMHFAGELLAKNAQLQMTHVAYRGCAPAMTDGIAGHVPILFNSFTVVKQMADQGKLRILAITAKERSAFAPDIPTVRETMPALKDVVVDLWTGILAPAGTPAAVVAQLNAALNKVLDAPETKARFDATQVATANKTTPQAMGTSLHLEQAKWAQLASSFGITVER